MSSQNRFCDRCGTAVPSLDSEFCSSCGSRLTVAMDEPTEASTSSAPRGAVAGGGRKGIQLARIILAVVSLFFPPFGVGVGLWYLLKKKERGFGGLLLGLAIMPLLLVSLLSSDNASDSDDSTGDVSEITSTATPTPAPTATATPTPVPTPRSTATPEPSPATSFSDGTWVVGADILHGTYRSSKTGGGCYWQRLSGFSGGFGDIIVNAFTDDLSLVEISSTDAGFSTEDCGTWKKATTRITSSLTSPFGDGAFIVGLDIASGTWRSSGGDSCYWERLSGFSGELKHLETNDFGGSNNIVTIQSSDTGFSSSDCGTWTKQ